MSGAYVPGLEGIIAAQTAISMVDGENGRLVYRGYVIADLAEDMSFEEVAHLFWYGHLPKHAELDGLAAELSGCALVVAWPSAGRARGEVEHRLRLADGGLSARRAPSGLRFLRLELKSDVR